MGEATKRKQNVEDLFSRIELPKETKQGIGEEFFNTEMPPNGIRIGFAQWILRTSGVTAEREQELVLEKLVILLRGGHTKTAAKIVVDWGIPKDAVENATKKVPVGS
jgi:hypothetical protein